MGNGGGTGGVGDGAEAGLVGEQAAAHAVEQRRDDAAGCAEEGLVEAEGALEDTQKDLGEAVRVEDDDHHGHEHVGQGHDGGQPLGDASHEADPAQDHGGGQQDEEDPDHPARQVGNGCRHDLGQ